MSLHLPTARWRRALGAASVTTLLTAGWVALPPTATGGVSQPGAEGSASDTVTAKPLPTWQVNGVVWDQTVIGNTVYAVGEFTKARPPYTKPGDPREKDVAHLFAYDIRTGNPITGFDHTLNAQARTIETSPDKTKLYIGGDFTTVNGKPRNYAAAFNVATGTLWADFQPLFGGPVLALAPTNTTVYAGGQFNGVAGTVRKRLAAVNARTGTLNQTWTPATDGNYVHSMTLTPNQDKVIIGGAFTTLNGAPARRIAAVDPTAGARVPWKSDATAIGGAGNVIGLKTEGDTIYGAAWDQHTGADGYFEGAFALDPADGSAVWKNNCYGDTYDIFPMNGTAYTASHAHHCDKIGGFIGNQRALAFATERTTSDSYSLNEGDPAAQLRQWFPDFSTGNYTSSGQAGWTVDGNGDYLTIGGEFLAVGGMPQQGLVRFAVRDAAPGARSQGPKHNGAAPSVTATQYGVRVKWYAGFDADDASLRYEIHRDGAHIATVRAESTFWEKPYLKWTDRSAEAGGRYHLVIKDADDNTVTTPAAASVGPRSDMKRTRPYALAVTQDGAASHWSLDKNGADEAGGNDVTFAQGTFGARGLTDDPEDGAVELGALGNGYNSAKGQSPNGLTGEVWVKTTRSGTRVLGFGDANSGYSNLTDRHLYLDTEGRPRFGAYDQGEKTAVAGPTPINDGQWHHLVGVMGNDALTLYVDGQQVATQQATAPMSYGGYWRIGNDTLLDWPGAPTTKPTDDPAAASMAVDEAVVYNAPLTAAQIAEHYRLGQTP